ncbi:MAG: hypothetical protein EHM41_11845 [Chloroflexi bacterium]|nr:MAG: hypothetical protein EHM41_11845 [Chloroflexota bacterium]
MINLKRFLWSGLLLLPLLGLLTGYAYAHIFFNGIFAPWHLVGKPGKNIERIIGIRDVEKIIVAAESGDVYSLEFMHQGEVALPSQLLWEAERADMVDSAYSKDWGEDFRTLPPPFSVKQLIMLEYVYKVEGRGEVKFALDDDGNLWMWNHAIAGLTGLVYFFHPVIGLMVGLVVVLVVFGINWLKRIGALQFFRAKHFGFL